MTNIKTQPTTAHLYFAHCRPPTGHGPTPHPITLRASFYNYGRDQMDNWQYCYY